MVVRISSSTDNDDATHHGPNRGEACKNSSLYEFSIWICARRRVVVTVAVKSEICRPERAAHAWQVRITLPIVGKCGRLIREGLAGAWEILPQRRICGHPLRKPRIEVARAEVVEAGLGVEFLAGEEVRLRQ